MAYKRNSLPVFKNGQIVTATELNALADAITDAAAPTQQEVYVQDKVILQAGTNITLTNDDANSKITINASGGGSGTITSILPTPNEIDVDNTIPSTPKIGLDNAVKTAITNNTTHIGDITKLLTTAKDNLVNAINEVQQDAETAGNLATAFANIDAIVQEGNNIQISRDTTNEKLIFSATGPTITPIPNDKYVKIDNTDPTKPIVGSTPQLTTDINDVSNQTQTNADDIVNVQQEITNLATSIDTLINVPAPISRDASSTQTVHNFSYATLEQLDVTTGKRSGFYFRSPSTPAPQLELYLEFKSGSSVGSQQVNNRIVTTTIDTTGKFLVVTSTNGNFTTTDWQLYEAWQLNADGGASVLKPQVDKNTADIAALQGQYSTLDTSLKMAEGNITSLTTRMTTAEQGIIENANNINVIYNNLSQQLTVPNNFNLTLSDPKMLTSPDMSTIAGWVEDFGTNYTIEVYNTTNLATQYIDVEIGKVLVNQHWYEDIVNVIYDTSTHTFKLQSQNPLTVNAGTIKGIELIGASGSTSPWKQLEDQTAWTYDSTNQEWNRTNWTTLPNNAQYRIEANDSGNSLYSIITSDKYLVNGGNGISKWDWQGSPLLGTGCWFRATVGASQSGLISFVDKTGTNVDSTSARFTIYVKLGYL